MSTLTVYSSQPLSTPLACACLNLEAKGYAVVVRPLHELEQALATVPRPLPRRSDLPEQLLAITLRLAEIGDRLTQADYGLLRLELGEAQGLRAEADDLRSRQRGLVATIQALPNRPAPPA